MKPLGDREVWLLVGAQELYGAAAVAEVAQHAREVARALDAEPELPVRVVEAGVALSSESIRRWCLDANAADACAGLLLWMHTFSPAKSWIAGLSLLRKPVLHLHTQFHRELPWAEIDMAFMNLNQSAHGDRELGFMQTRMGLRRKTVAGHWRDPTVVRRIANWTRAACGWHELQQLEIARFGDNMRRVAVTEGDKVEAQLRLGVAVNGYGIDHLSRAVGEAGGAEIDALVGTYEQEYDLVPALRLGGERRAALRDAARIEVGLRSFLDAGGFKAFTDTFEDLGDLPQLPGIGVQRLMADGYGFGAEGDWKTAALLRAAKVMGAGLPGGSSFMEDYTYDLTPGGSASSAPTCSRSVPRSQTDGRRVRSTRSRSAVGTIRSGSSSQRAVGRRWSRRSSTLATASACSSTRSSSRRPPMRCRTCRSPGRCGGRNPTFLPRPRHGSWRAALTTPCSATLSTRRRSPTWRRSRGSISSSSMRDTNVRDLGRELGWSDAHHRLAAESSSAVRGAPRAGRRRESRTGRGRSRDPDVRERERRLTARPASSRSSRAESGMTRSAPKTFAVIDLGPEPWSRAACARRPTRRRIFSRAGVRRRWGGRPYAFAVCHRLGAGAS